MSRRRTSLPERHLSSALSDPQGREVVKIEALPLHAGHVVRLVFEQVRSPWRQGVWIATEGVLQIGDSAASQFVLWTDTAPPEVRIGCEKTDGLLRFYNVWDSGRKLGPFESQSDTSGMVVDVLEDGSRRYSCADIGLEPNFEKLVFRISIG
jgi:hypothetical protein